MFFLFNQLLHSQKKSNFALVIELERHIEILLLNNDCVIVPDFGGFMTHHVDAHYDEQQQMFYPPLRTIGFNPQLTVNDSLLVQSYIDVYDISYPEALRRIESEVCEVKQYLANKGSYEMPDIGTIYYHQNKGYTFTPCEAGILTPELYGLSSVELKPLFDDKQCKEDTAEKRVSTITTSKSKHTTLTGDTNTVDAQLLNEQKKPSKRTIEIKISVLRNLAAACIAIIAFFLFPVSLNQTAKQANIFGKINTNLLCRIMPKDVTIGKDKITSLSHSPSQSKDNKQDIKNTLQIKEKGPQQALKTKKETKKTFYAIVLASKVTIKNATAYVQSLHREGLKDAQIYTKNKHTKVIYGQYNTQQDAYKALNNLKHLKAFTEGWVTEVILPNI